MARKILLADDSVTAQNMGRKILVDAGYEVIAVNNGSAALKKIAELKPDLAILDVYMPGYSGLEVCQRLKESQESAGMPVLLTVGKLEPFKPEEAQRVRAEGYIVKPFEASELLSALSKLEDKVVPRAESSKPGRFARAIATAEETGRGSRGQTASYENGWKSRIGFPHQKPESEVSEEKVADDSSIYNPLNRDLRTVVETAAEKVEDKSQLSAHDAGPTIAQPGVDVSALASSSLPSDVTPEEVAAIAAAVAKMQMSAAAIEDDRFAAGATHTGRDPVPDIAAGHLDSEMKIAAAEERCTAAELVAAPIDNERNGDESSNEISSNERSSEERSSEERSLNQESLYQQSSNQQGSNQESSNSQSSNQESSNLQSSDQQSSNQSGSEQKEETHDVPVTMAATADMAAASVGASRWTAVAVALESDETGLSLEQEMQKAYAAAEPYLAAVAAMPEETAPPAESPSPRAEPALEAQAAVSSRAEAEAVPAAPVMVAEFKETEASPVAQSEAAALSASFATAAEAKIEEPAMPQLETAVIDSVSSEAARLVASSAAEYVEPNPAPVEDFERPAFAAASSGDTEFAHPSSVEPPAVGRSSVEPSPVEPSPVDSCGQTAIAPSGANAAQELLPASIDEGAEAMASSTAAFAPIIRDMVRNDDEAAEPRLDTEGVKSTAAAWASWRQIRDTSKGADMAEIHPKGNQPTEFDLPANMPQSAAPETAAAAVAAGAEQALQATAEPSRNSADVASIVESVLADLRPKLMEEISRKMAEKK